MKLIAAMTPLPLALLLIAEAPAPQQQIQNGKVETRRTTAIDREITALAATPEPVWAAWRVPMIEGDRRMCSWWSDQTGVVRGELLDYNMTGTTIVGAGGQKPQIAPPTGPLPLEAGTQLLVLVRLLDGRVERLRTVGDDCPIDAQGRTVYWLEGVTPAESVRYLDSLVRLEGDARTQPLPRLQSNIASSALSAIAYHADPTASSVLDRIAGGERDTHLRQSAMSRLATLRGAAGFATLRTLLDAERTPEIRRQLVSALGQTREPGTGDVMRALLKDPDARIRAEAVYVLAARSGPGANDEITRLLESEADTNVKKRALSGIYQQANGAGIPALIQLARTHKDPVVRKEAVATLSRSRDPRATAFMEELVKR
jgi:hypothetical protein